MSDPLTQYLKFILEKGLHPWIFDATSDAYDLGDEEQYKESHDVPHDRSFQQVDQSQPCVDDRCRVHGERCRAKCPHSTVTESLPDDDEGRDGQDQNQPEQRVQTCPAEKAERFIEKDDRTQNHTQSHLERHLPVHKLQHLLQPMYIHGRVTQIGRQHTPRTERFLMTSSVG